jgi:hypothetical protein
MKLFLASLLAVGLSISAYAADNVPVSTLGEATLPAYAGASVCTIDSSTGTNTLLCYAGKGVVLSIIGSSVAATDQLVFRDSGSLASNGNLLGKIDKAAMAEERQTLFTFYKGLNVKSTVSPPPATGMWTIIYRKITE